MKARKLGIICLAALLLFSAAAVVRAQDDEEEEETEWCAEQRELCEENCAEYPNATTQFECIDEVLSVLATRGASCTCVDPEGNVLSSSTTGGTQTTAGTDLGGGAFDQQSESTTSSSSTSGG